MTNALDYLRWRGDMTVAEDPVNEVDLFLCSQLATPDFTEFLGKKQEMRLSEVAQRYFATHSMDVSNLGLLQSRSVLPMLQTMAVSRRYENVLLISAVNRVKPGNMEQFQAVTIRLDKDLLVVSFRGTDDTLIGWKEDCYLAVQDEVPAQRDAVQYLEHIARAYPEDSICIVGHSKGGNLALFTAMNAAPEIQKRIVRAVGFDSPGFSLEALESEGYLRVADRIVTVVSQHSIVGVLLYAAGKYALVHSAVAGPMAHDGFNWEVEGTAFVRAEKLSDFSTSFSVACNITLESLNVEGRKEFIDDLFNILLSTGAQTVTELVNKGILTSLQTVTKLAKSASLRKFIAVMIVELEKAGKNVDEIREMFAETMECVDEIPEARQADIRRRVTSKQA